MPGQLSLKFAEQHQTGTVQVLPPQKQLLMLKLRVQLLAAASAAPVAAPAVSALAVTALAVAAAAAVAAPTVGQQLLLQRPSGSMPWVSTACRVFEAPGPVQLQPPQR